MEHFAKGRDLCHGVDDPVRHVFRVRCDEPHPSEAGGGSNVPEQVGEGLLGGEVRTPRVDVLTQEGYLQG